jgi:hypothetical protein
MRRKSWNNFSVSRLFWRSRTAGQPPVDSFGFQVIPAGRPYLAISVPFLVIPTGEGGNV